MTTYSPIIISAGGTLSHAVMERAIRTYRHLHLNDSGTFTYDGIGSGAGLNNFLNRLTSFTIIDAPAANSKFVSNPNLQQLPFIATSIVVSYNLPGINELLVLDVTTIGAIFLGTIQRWNDPSIQTLNPNLQLPDQPIKVIVRHEKSGTTESFVTGVYNTTTLQQINPSPSVTLNFDTYGTYSTSSSSIQLPNWCQQTNPANITSNGFFFDQNCSNGMNYLRSVGTEGLAVGISITPYSIGYLSYNEADAMQLKSATIINVAGYPVRPGVKSVVPALMASEGLLNSNGQWSGVSLSGTNESGSWPIVAAVYLVYDSTSHIEDCATRSILLRFFEWIMTNDEFRNIAESSGFAMLTVYSRSIMMDNMLNTIRCGGQVNTTANAVKFYTCASINNLCGNVSYQPVLPRTMWLEYTDTAVLPAITSIEDISTSFIGADYELHHVQQISGTNVSIQNQDAMVDLLNQQANTIVLPLFILPLNVLYNLGSDESVIEISLPKNILAMIFDGTITTWSDSRVRTVLSNATYSSNLPIRIVLESHTIADPLLSYLGVAQLPSNVLIVESTRATVYAISALIGSIGLGWGSQGFPQGVHVMGIDSLRGTLSAIQPCFSINQTDSFTARFVKAPISCWPLTTEYYLVAPRSPIGTDVEVHDVARLAAWMDGSLSLLSSSATVLPRDNTQIAISTSILNEMRHNKRSILNPEPLCSRVDVTYTVGSCNIETVTFPVNFSWVAGDKRWCLDGLELPTTVNMPCDFLPHDSSMGVGLQALIGICAVINFITLMMIIYFRKTKVMVKSQIKFTMLCTASSAGLCLTCLTLFGATTTLNCQLTIVLMPLLSTLLFSCLIMKLDRIRTLFTTKKLKRIIYTDGMVGRRIFLFLVVDVVIIVVWFVINRPIQTITEVEDAVIMGTYPRTTCSYSTTLMNVMVGWKVVMLLIGVVLSIRVWNVSGEYSEAKPVAIAIYNAVLLGGITFILQSSQTEPMRVAVMTIMTCWVSTFAILLVVGPKLWILRIPANRLDNSSRKSQVQSSCASLQLSEGGEGGATELRGPIKSIVEQRNRKSRV